MDNSSEYTWYNEISRTFLKKDYLLPGQTLDQRVGIICSAFQKYLEKKLSKNNAESIANTFKENFKKGWYSLSTPVWTNYGTDRGDPISCFGSYVSDNMESILYSQAEIGMMSKRGGGTSVYLGNLRPRGSQIRNNGKSSGSVHFAQLFEKQIQVISQGSSRRGNCAAYLNIDHADIEEFLGIKRVGHPIQDLSFGVCIPEGWMASMIEGDAQKRKIWAKVLESRFQTGYPYLWFLDNVNGNAPDVYKDKNRKITHSNLCSEIALSDNDEESFVCCLSSMNLLHYDDWKNTNAPEILVYFLDSVMEEFIQKTEGVMFMDRANRFAKNQRALGLGVLGWHSFLQKKMISFESMEAKFLNNEIFSSLQQKTLKASQELAQIFGEPEMLKGYGRRNTTLMAIAPTKSSSAILGQVSEGIEPIKSNYFVKDLAKTKFSFKNVELEKILEAKGYNTDKVWDQILADGGSVQNIERLSDEEKAVFKTFEEISPKEVIIQAANRQRYIDQGQSLNLMIHPKTPIKDVNALIIEAWKLGVKGLYYQHSINASRSLINDILDCKSCQ